MSIWDFEKEFRKIDREYPNRPDWGYPYDNMVYDEDKSVKWNREKNLEEQARWKEEKRALEEAKRSADKAVEERLIEFIVDNINITKNGAKVMWERCDWDFGKLETLMDDYYYIKEADV